MTAPRLSSVDRANLRAALDQWLDAVEARPLSLDDGEYHYIEITASRVSVDDDGELLMSFTLKTASEVQL